MHVIGKTDVVVVEERSQQLVAVSANARVEEHEGGKHDSLFDLLILIGDYDIFFSLQDILFRLKGIGESF